MGCLGDGVSPSSYGNSGFKYLYCGAASQTLALGLKV
jgi:hypothetical protein